MAVLSQNPSPQVRHTGLRSRLQTNAGGRGDSGLRSQEGARSPEQTVWQTEKRGGQLISGSLSPTLGCVEDFGRTLEVLSDMTTEGKR